MQECPETVDIEELPTERLEAEITTLAGHVAAGMCRWLLLVSEFERRGAWADYGCKSCAHWIAWQCSMDDRTAREHVRVARALPELPRIRDAFAVGGLSYTQVRALTRSARPDNEDELLRIAHYATGSQLDKVVRAYNSVQTLREQARDAYESREVVWWHAEDGSLVVQAKLPAEDGAVVIEALKARAEELRHADSEAAGAHGGSAEPVRPAARTLLADALIDITAGSGNGSGGTERVERFAVVVNVDLDRMAADADGTCALECGTVLAPETARRLACDKPVVAVHHTDGRPRAGGRRTRFASKRLNRVLDQRDRGCRFPGCNHTRYLHTHHIVHWAHGGSTSADNLVRLCSHHHRLVHEGGYTVTGDPAGELVFRRPNGRRLEQRPRRRDGCADSLTRLNRRNGVDPAAGTITSGWAGEKLDLDWVVTLLCDHDELVRARGPA